MKHVYGWLLLTPAAILLIGFTHYPAIATLVDSFFSTGTAVRPSRFVGLENYAALLDDPIFWQVFRNNAWFALGTIPTAIVIAMVMALWVNEKLPARALVRMAYFTPTVLPMIAPGASGRGSWHGIADRRRSVGRVDRRLAGSLPVLRAAGRLPGLASRRKRPVRGPGRARVVRGGRGAARRTQAVAAGRARMVPGAGLRALASPPAILGDARRRGAARFGRGLAVDALRRLVPVRIRRHRRRPGVDRGRRATQDAALTSLLAGGRGINLRSPQSGVPACKPCRCASSRRPTRPACRR